jgi:hypothetical protein
VRSSFAPFQAGEYASPSSAWISRSGAPFAVRIWNAPARSDSFTSVGAVPVFLIVTVFVVVVPSTCDLLTAGGVMVSCPALRVKSTRVALSAATLAVLVDGW